MDISKMPHLEHEKHLCFLVNIEFQSANPEQYKQLIKNGNFYCKTCGRVAADQKNLCTPEKL